MLGTSLKYLLRNPARLTSVLATGPLEAWIKFQDRYAERSERRSPIFQYEAETGWEERMHRLIGFPQPCGAALDFNTVWTETVGSLRAKGIRVGTNGFGPWNDGDAGLSRAIWCLVL